MEATVPGATASALRIRLALAIVLIALSASLAILPAIRAVRVDAVPSVTEFAVLGVAITLVSLLGIVAALRPSGCNRLLSLSSENPRASSTAPAPRGCTAQGLVGHHLNCGAFSGHTARIAGRIACAGCMGMVAGGTAGVLLGLAVASGLVPTDRTYDAAMGLLGASLAMAGIFGAYRRNATAGTRALASFVLVTGSVTFVAGLAGRGLFFGAFGLAAALAVLGLRVDMSRLQHASVCAECTERLAATTAAGAGGAGATAR